MFHPFASTVAPVMAVEVFVPSLTVTVQPLLFTEHEPLTQNPMPVISASPVVPTVAVIPVLLLTPLWCATVTLPAAAPAPTMALPPNFALPPTIAPCPKAKEQRNGNSQSSFLNCLS